MFKIDTMKRFFLSVLYAILILIVGWSLYLILSTHITMLLFGYKNKPYLHEVDFLFPKDSLNTLIASNTYKSGKKSAIYFLSQRFNDMTIIESSNFIDIEMDDLAKKGVEKIESTQDKTYSVYYHPPFPVIEQVLNPKKSNFFDVLIEGEYEIEQELRTDKFYYLLGNYNTICFSNTQICSIVSFVNLKNNEILILKHNQKLYCIMQTKKEKSILEIVNPKLISGS